jgi:hypothetical protein
VRICGDDGGQAIISIGYDGALAEAVDANGRQRSKRIFHSQAARAIDALASKSCQYPVAVQVDSGRPTQRPGQARPPFEPRDRHRRIGGAPAMHSEETSCLDFSVSYWELVDLENFVEHNDAGAENRARLRLG